MHTINAFTTSRNVPVALEDLSYEEPSVVALSGLRLRMPQEAIANARMAMSKRKARVAIPAEVVKLGSRISKGEQLQLSDCRSIIWYRDIFNIAGKTSDNPWVYPGYCSHMLLGGDSGYRAAKNFCDALKDFSDTPSMDSAGGSGSSKNSKRCGASTVEAGDNCNKPVVVRSIKTERGVKKTPTASASEEVNEQRKKAAAKSKGNTRMQSVLSQIMSGKITTAAAAVEALKSKSGEVDSELKGKIVKALKEKRGESVKGAVLKTTKSKN